MKQVLFILAFFIIGVPSISFSADKYKDTQYLAKVKEVFGHKQTQKSLTKIRDLYKQTSFYDPILPPPEIAALAKEYKETGKMDPQEAYEALVRHFALMDTHLFFYNILMDKKSEDMAGPHAATLRHYADIIKATGDGKSAKTAYKALNKSEQVVFIRFVLATSFEKKRLENIDGQMFDIYETIDPATQAKQDVYFNITGQLAWLKALDKVPDPEKGETPKH